MGKNLKKIVSISVYFFLLIQIFVSAGCSQVTPELTEANYSVIFEYADNETFPDSRLSLFMESNTDISRYERIKITAMENSFIWDFTDFSKIESSEHKWAGSTNLVVPEDEIIPSGMYEVKYFNADEKETTVYVTISYDTSIYDLTAEELVEKMQSDGASKKIAIYDESDVLLYYGEKYSEYETARGIWNSYRQASYYYDIWCTAGNYVICIMPQQKVSLETE